MDPQKEGIQKHTDEDGIDSLGNNDLHEIIGELKFTLKELQCDITKHAVSDIAQKDQKQGQLDILRIKDAGKLPVKKTDIHVKKPV